MIFSKIFVKISSIFDAIPKLSLLKARYSSAFLLGFSFLIFCSCTTKKTVPLETLHHDTLYINKLSYDSIYIDNTHLIDRGGDTITITKTKTEYRFKLLCDTIRIARIDSIPYEVRIVETKQVNHIPPWCKWLSAMGGIAILILIITCYLKLKSFV